MNNTLCATGNFQTRGFQIFDSTEKIEKFSVFFSTEKIGWIWKRRAEIKYLKFFRSRILHLFCTWQTNHLIHKNY